MSVPTCKCGYALTTQMCPDCSMKLPDSTVVSLPVGGKNLEMPPIIQPTAWRRSTPEYDGPPMDEQHRQWLLQFEAAVLSKVVASLLVRYNNLQVNGFLVEADLEKGVERMFVVKINLNGVDRAVKIPLDRNDSRSQIACKVRDAVAAHMAERVMLALSEQWQEGSFRKTPR